MAGAVPVNATPPGPRGREWVATSALGRRVGRASPRQPQRPRQRPRDVGGIGPGRGRDSWEGRGGVHWWRVGAGPGGRRARATKGRGWGRAVEGGGREGRRAGACGGRGKASPRPRWRPPPAPGLARPTPSSRTSGRPGPTALRRLTPVPYPFFGDFHQGSGGGADLFRGAERPGGGGLGRGP